MDHVGSELELNKKLKARFGIRIQGKKWGSKGLKIDLFFILVYKWSFMNAI